nr:3-alpha-(or 20-beta)-hydroxysteroid dehydrogenase-like [Nerophis lumbriciformis]
MRLNDKVAIITGAGSGIGAESARRFVEEGARVLIADMQDDKGQAVADELGNAAEFLHVDVSQEQHVEAAVAEAVAKWGKLDIIFNNAGFGGALGSIETTTVDDFDITFDVLVKGVFLGIKHAIPAMRAAGGGAIINTASVAGLQAGYSPHLYSVAKSAVIHMTKSVALEVGQDNIRCNCICPGIIATPLAAGHPNTTNEQLAKLKSALGKTQVLGKIGDPVDIANAAVFLASDESGFITGHAQVVDGGAHAGKPWARQGEWITADRPIKMYRPEDR